MIRTAAILLLIAGLAPAVGAAPIHDLAAIERTVRQFVAAGAATAGDVEISVGRLDPRLRLPRCDETLDTRYPNARRSSGPVSVEVRCNGAKPWSLYVPVTLTRYAEVVVTTRPVARGQVLAPTDLALARRRVDGARADFLAGLNEAAGQVTRRSLAAGAVVGANQLERPRLVRRGDHVMLSSGHGGINVSVKGEALADGGAGERIRVRNLSSERVVEGIVNADGVVVVGHGAIL
ncbi:MAG: flagellar basal body P-ring formation protein FlgA [Gammaproteobacteria bacterium]|nr:flagellar basal body P-ring formation protein FlgA [Gammaproteobacteria bacterium]